MSKLKHKMFKEVIPGSTLHMVEFVLDLLSIFEISVTYKIDAKSFEILI